MAERKKKKKCPECAVPEYMLTYGDMVTLLLTFFVLLYSQMVPDAKKSDIQLVLAAFQGLGNFQGGNTLEKGVLADNGFPSDSFPSSKAGNSLSEAKKLAKEIIPSSSFQEKNKSVIIYNSERGLVISLSGDTFFNSASANIRMENSREVLYRIAQFLKSEGLSDKFFRIEGHADDAPSDSNGPWRTNWELASARANNVLHLLSSFEVDEKRMQSVSYGDVRPAQSNGYPEGRAYNRRVDIVVVTEGNLF